MNGYGVEWIIAACQQVMLLMVIERTTCEQLCLATMPEKFNPHHFTAGILQFQTNTQSFLGVEGAQLDYVARGINGDRVLPIVPGRIRPSGTPCWKGHIKRLKLKAWTLETAGWEWIRVQGRTRRLERAKRALERIRSCQLSC